MAAPQEQSRRRLSDIVLVCDHELRCSDASPATLPILGYSPEALTGRDVAELIRPEELAPVRNYLTTATPETASLPVTLIHRDGGPVAMVASRHGEDGLDFAPRDVSERVRMQEWIASQEAMSEAILTNASDAIISTARDGRIVEWNHAAEAMFGWPRSEVLGRAATDTIVPPELREQYQATVDELVDGGAAPPDRPVEAVLTRRDGSRVETQFTGWAVQVGPDWRFNLLVREVRKEPERRLADARTRASGR